jgi:hypothetical protein
MSIEISHEIEVRLTEEARKQGVSVDALLEQLMSGSGETAHLAENGSVPKVPILRLGAMGSLHRRDLYDDAG